MDEFFRLFREWTDLVDFLLRTLPPVDFFSFEIAAVFISRFVLSPLIPELAGSPSFVGMTSSWKLRALCERDVFVVGHRVFLFLPDKLSSVIFGSEPIESCNPLSTYLLELFFLLADDDLLDDKAFPSSSLTVGSTKESLRRFTLSSPLPLSLYCAFRLFSMSAF